MLPSPLCEVLCDLPTNDRENATLTEQEPHGYHKDREAQVKMDDPNITMEEYIRLQEEKALSRGKTFNWQTATYGKMEYCEDEDDCFTNFESEFPAIVLDNTITPREAL
ncbi:hypothetical protein Tco_0578121 [Tanacetum coccineum]